MATPIDLKIRLFFSIHKFDHSTDLKTFAKDFSNSFFKKNYNRIIFRLSPRLEEEVILKTVKNKKVPDYAAMDDRFSSEAQTLFDNLDSDGVCSTTNYPRLIRSPLDSGVSSSSELLKVTCSGKRVSKSVSVEREWHGETNLSGFASWSNDGINVYSTNEDSTHTLTPNDETTSIKVSEFVATANKFSGKALLWRPRYNLAPYKDFGAKYPDPATAKKYKATDFKCPNYQMPSRAGQKLAYCTATSERGLIQSRIDGTDSAVFDSLEASVLKTFLTTLR